MFIYFWVQVHTQNYLHPYHFKYTISHIQNTDNEVESFPHSLAQQIVRLNRGGYCSATPFNNALGFLFQGVTFLAWAFILTQNHKKWHTLRACRHGTTGLQHFFPPFLFFFLFFLSLTFDMSLFTHFGLPRTSTLNRWLWFGDVFIGSNTGASWWCHRKASGGSTAMMRTLVKGSL